MSRFDTLPDGVWPTMVTPFTQDGSLDFHGLEALVEWYISEGVDGLFAVCQSSEMFTLSLDERVELARATVRFARGRVPVIASGHVSDSLTDQIEEIKRVSGTGIAAFVLVSNKLAGAGESDDVWKRNAERIFAETEEIRLGLYECPYPYKRSISPELLGWCVRSGRFDFLKDTCCDIKMIEEKLAGIGQGKLKLYNANSATLLQSLRLGAAGFSGVMANFHPGLYVWLVKNWRDRHRQAQLLQGFLGIASLMELAGYPYNAKRYLQRKGLPIHPYCRVMGEAALPDSVGLQLEQLMDVERYVQEHIIQEGIV